MPGRPIVAAALAVGVLTTAAASVRADGPAPGAARMACEDGGRPKLPPLRLHVVDRAGLSDDVRDALMREALVPWHAVGVDVAWSPALPDAPPPPGTHDDVYVILVAADDGTRRPMASIRFVDGRPTTHVTVYAGYVARRLADIRIDDRRLADGPRLVRDRVLGRVLGRAVAHELGHFLLGSSAHTRGGLMRARHRIDHLLAPAPGRFAVTLPATAACLVAGGGALTGSRPAIRHEAVARSGLVRAAP